MIRPKSDATYTLGQSTEETKRLVKQSKLYETITRQLFEEAGIDKGQKVLDLGSGAGDVALIIRELVGETGNVVGIDVNGEILETARSRAKELEYDNIVFLEGDWQNIEPSESFDAVVGRLVLMYISNPTEALRKLQTHLNPGGVFAFEELDFKAWQALRSPQTPLFNSITNWCIEVFEKSGAHIDVGFDLHRIFVEAGLPEPFLHVSAPIGGNESWLGYEYVANSFRSLLPLIDKYSIATSEEIDVNTLAERVRQEVIASKRPFILPFHVTAWSKLA